MPSTTPVQMRTTPTASWIVRRFSVAALALLVSPIALANTVALVPMLPNGAQPQRVQDVFQLMSSELEFMAGIDSVQEVKSGANLTPECLDDASCLARIASSARADSVLTGVITDQGATIVLDIVYHDGGAPRRQAFTVPSDATALANQMTEMLQQVIAGRNSAQAAADEADTATFTSALDDDDDFMMPTPVAAAPRPAPAPASSGYDFSGALVDAGPTAEEKAYQARQIQAQQQAQLRAQQQAQLRAQQQAQMQAQQQAQVQAQMRAQQQAQIQAQQQAQIQAQQQAQLQAQRQAQLRAQQEAQQRAQQEAQRQAQLRAQQEAQQQAQMQAQRQAQQQAAQQAQLQAQQEAQRQAQQEAQRQAQLRVQQPAPQAGGLNISFASSADKIQAQEIDAAIQFGPPPSSNTPAPAYGQQAAYGQQQAPTYGQQPQAPAYGQQAPAYGQKPQAPAYGQQAPAPAYGQQAPAYGQQAQAPAYQQQAQAPAYGQQAPAYQQQRPPAPAYQTPPSPYQAPAYQRPTPNPARDPLLAQEERDLRDMKSPGLDGLDGQKERGRAKMTGSNEVTLSDTRATHVQVTGRGGYSRYGNFDFVTAGGELGVRVYDGVTLLAGVESYSVQRELPIEAQTPGQNIYTWNTIFPINVGAVYQIETGTVARPYVGADAIFVQYFADAEGTEWAGGARARLGLDLMVVPNFGFNANVAVGMWSGKKWTLIDPGLNNSSFLPQFNGGLVFAF